MNRFQELNEHERSIIEYLRFRHSEQPTFKIWKGINKSRQLSITDLKKALVKLTAAGYLLQVPRSTGGFNYLVNTEDPRFIEYVRSAGFAHRMMFVAFRNIKLVAAATLGVILLILFVIHYL